MNKGRPSLILERRVDKETGLRPPLYLILVYLDVIFPFLRRSVLFGDFSPTHLVDPLFLAMA